MVIRYFADQGPSGCLAFSGNLKKSGGQVGQWDKIENSYIKQKDESKKMSHFAPDWSGTEWDRGGQERGTGHRRPPSTHTSAPP